MRLSKMLFVLGFGFFGNTLCRLKVQGVWLKENACCVCMKFNFNLFMLLTLSEVGQG